MASAYQQLRWRCVQRLIGDVAVALASVALTLGEIRFGSIVFPQSPWLGVFLAAAGVLLVVAAVVALCTRAEPSGRS
ncbi:hypothetical protein [Brachybacterium sp. p3-SID957]|uniref:hypothetical protein n=1 Tax=Brachybacterium sp. p3-SID957 TaxID=2916049 RepID=UPI00223BCA16|nr:hypothetical protein [Brachybacterium sp. p3-SID957]MCT1777043.1 hypothetical protein [Brachybacterium sp. p3-SID957]